MGTPSDDGLREYAYNTHIRWVETQVFNLAGGRDLTRYQRMAREDLRRDLRRLGYIDPLEPRGWENGYPITGASRQGEIANRSRKAEGVARLSAGVAGASLVAGVVLQDLDPYGDADAQPSLDSAQGAYRWELVDAVELAANETRDVAVIATVAGTPHNLCPLGVGMYLATANPAIVGVELREIVSEGVDHQLARLATYRALELLYTDLLTATGDLPDTKRGIYAKRYKEEFDRVTSAGVEVTKDGNADVSDEESRLRHGTVRRYRS